MKCDMIFSGEKSNRGGDMVDIFIQIVPKLVAAFLIMMIYIHLSGKVTSRPV